MFSKMFSVCAAALVCFGVCGAEIAVKSGDKIAFLGDSITQLGNSSAGGYVNLVISGLNANGIKAVKIPAGISGNKSNQMLARVDSHVIAKKPQIMTLSCGVNDVWHGARGIPLPQYKKNITELVDKVQAAGIKVCILTATMITENPDYKLNQQLKPYNDFLRQLAKEKKCMLADLNFDMQKTIADFKQKNPGFKGSLCTYDGVHMNAFGDTMMAKGILRTFGLNDAQIAKAEKAWLGKKVNIGRVELAAEDVKKLAVLAAKENVSIQTLIPRIIQESIAK